MNYSPGKPNGKEDQRLFMQNRTGLFPGSIKTEVIEGTAGLVAPKKFLREFRLRKVVRDVGDRR
jgi:hypothetical protein